MTLSDGFYRANNGLYVYIVRIEMGYSKECIRIDIREPQYSNSSAFQETWGTFTPATTEEKYWLSTCIKAKKILPKPVIPEPLIYQIY